MITDHTVSCSTAAQRQTSVRQKQSAHTHEAYLDELMRSIRATASFREEEFEDSSSPIFLAECNEYHWNQEAGDWRFIFMQLTGISIYFSVRNAVLYGVDLIVQLLNPIFISVSK